MNENDTTEGSHVIHGAIRHKPLSTEELAALLQAARGSSVAGDLRDIVTIIVNTGLRANELRELRWDHVDFNDCNMIVANSRQARKVPFGKKVKQVLKSRRGNQPESAYVFGPWPETLVYRVKRELRRLSSQLGIAPVRICDLRHIFLWRWINSGGSFETLALVAGYKFADQGLENLVPVPVLYQIAAIEQAKLENEEF